MNLAYRLMYAFGATPWDQDPTPQELLDLIEGPASRAPGRALDLGCGTGADAVALAQRGWKVTAVDAVPRALEAARRRSAEAGVSVEWIHGDVASLGDAGVTGSYDLVYDVGCFHGLTDRDRRRCADGINALTGPAAVLLMFAFMPGRRGPLPRGIDADDLVDVFSPYWQLVESHRAEDVTLSGPLQNADPHWYRLQRTSPAK